VSRRTIQIMKRGTNRRIASITPEEEKAIEEEWNGM
jgi:hypothetical protein